MTRDEYLLDVVAEECAEIQQAVSKILRFGPRSFHPNNPVVSNSEQMLVEYYQLEAMIAMLLDFGIVNPLNATDIDRIREYKKEKVKKYMEVSKSLGCLTE